MRDERAWLTTVVGRVCLDRLRSAAARRERYVGPWLPEPLITTPDDDGPLATVVRDESVRMAAMVVLERLSPPQRVAFVLHDALDLPFATIADVLGCTEATARQHATRARRIVAEQRAAAARPRRPAGPAGPVRRRDGPRRPRRAGRPCCTRTRCWSTTATAGCARRGARSSGRTRWPASCSA